MAIANPNETGMDPNATNPNWTPINPMGQMTPEQAAAAQATAAEAAAENFYLSQAKERYGYIDSIFTTNDELKKLLIDAVKNNLSKELFQEKLTSSQWYIKNAGSIQARGFARRQYQELTKNLNKSDPDYKNKVKAVAGDSEYYRGLDTTKAALARELNTKGIEYTEENLDAWSVELYDSANEKNTAFISRYLNTKIGASSITKGEGATNIEDLADYASDQGLIFDKDFTKAQQTVWVQRLDAGESLAAIKKEIETAAMMGESESVQNLMKQGLTRSTIYQPLVARANSKLQRVDMTMNDEWLQKNAKDEKGNLRPVWQMDSALMQHPDWEFTDEAHEKVGDVTLKILRDFGFQG
jgi:hypothetical protein